VAKLILIESQSDSGLQSKTDRAVYKLELDNLKYAKKQKESTETTNSTPQTDSSVTSNFRGNVHSAGYGTKLKEFKEATQNRFQGEGIVVAIYDSGIDISWTSVFQDRIKDIIISDDNDWFEATTTLDEYKTHLKSLAEKRNLDQDDSTRHVGPYNALLGLEDVANNSTLRFVSLFEARQSKNNNGVGFDFNGDHDAPPWCCEGDEITIAVYLNSEGFPEESVCGVELVVSVDSFCFLAYFKLSSSSL